MPTDYLIFSQSNPQIPDVIYQLLYPDESLNWDANTALAQALHIEAIDEPFQLREEYAFVDEDQWGVIKKAFKGYPKVKDLYEEKWMNEILNFIKIS